MPGIEFIQFATLNPDWLFIGRVVISVLLALMGLYLTAIVLMFAINQFVVVAIGKLLLQVGRDLLDFSVRLLNKKYTAIFGRISLELSNSVFRGYLFLAKLMQKILVGLLAILLPGITFFIVFAIFAFEPINLAKAFIAIFMLIVSTIFIVLIIQCRNMLSALTNLEANMIEMRDEVMFNGTMVRAQLAQLNERMASKQVISIEDYSKQAIKTVGPLLLLLFRKEKNLIQWSIAGLNFGKAVFSYFTQKRKK